MRTRSEKKSESWSGLNVTVNCFLPPGGTNPSSGAMSNTDRPVKFCGPENISMHETKIIIVNYLLNVY
jgi:hypothetical protein